MIHHGVLSDQNDTSVKPDSTMAQMKAVNSAAAHHSSPEKDVEPRIYLEKLGNISIFRENCITVLGLISL